MLTLYISVFLFNVVAIFMKKRLAAIDYYCSIYFGAFWALLSDAFVDQYNMYYFFDPNVFEIETMWILFGIYPAAIMLIINWYPYKKSWIKKASYILAWSIFSSFYEWLSLKSGFLHYVQWKIWYSAILYPFLYAGLMLNLYFIHWLIKKSPPPEM
jgi:hypothetical protein